MVLILVTAAGQSSPPHPLLSFYLSLFSTRAGFRNNYEFVVQISVFGLADNLA